MVMSYCTPEITCSCVHITAGRKNQTTKMADIKFLVDDDDNAEEEQEDDGLEDETDDNSMLDKEIPEELISPLTKMDRYMNSEIIFNRRMASRCVLECLRSVKSDEECYTVLQAMVRLSDDIEAAVRIEVMEQIPHVAVLCVEHRGLHFAISQYILPVVVRYLTDPNNQVRKTSQAALLLLLEQDVIERVEIEQQICPVLIQLCSIDSTDDFRTEAVTLMSKMAPMVGREITERYFLGQFDNLCSDPLFHVRKVCAGNFGEICEVVGNELTEKRLLPVFIKLCQDGVWGVRKACAECFMNVSTVASREVRKNRLAPLFINLLGDKSRWVQMAAYQSLGPFISTFADPRNSGFYVDQHGKLCKFVIPDKSEGESSSEETIGDEKKNANDLSLLTESNGIEVKTTDSGYMSPPEAHLDGDLNENQTFDSPVDTETCIDMKPTDAILDTYNSFNYWRTPIPSIFDSDEDEDDDDDNIFEDRNGDMTSGDLKSESDDMSSDDLKMEVDVNNDFSLDKPNQTSDDLPAVNNLGLLDVDTDDNAKDLVCIENVEDSPEQMQPLPAVSSLRLNDDYLQPYSSNICFDEDRSQLSSPPQSPYHEQKVIPQPLLDHFISMTEPSKAQAIDTDLAKHCAFSFPAVTLTLGARNWKCLKDTYEHLSSDMQWKVRRTLAFSIHELSEILGAHITRMDLVPIFDNFLKDLDEVRIGVLKNLARFVKLLAPDLRANYLKNYTDFLSTDNARNWRFRYELAEQLIMLVDVYQGAEVSEFICPIALSLGADRVAEVRLISYKLVGILLLKLNPENSSEFRKKFIDEIVEHYASNTVNYARCCSKKISSQLRNLPSTFYRIFFRTKRTRSSTLNLRYRGP
ncbi:serine/threonine-protein phosphatase 4 regulatory subunit 1-like isoform X2 [Xenia sp. Carnegie-2017]|uniref:serine/threonine-protein phosphatase 4 regulatory subunit 1-like isoform X2 n=1 Tax=Xenia sp. Carnegie-2017 TaxID=2897299 RepID=UPI001F045C0C|nr:serine/threonine-protein phosphatase 4 regulatory subunit 1-like isoform X2 [Xenia sp. Carnegie-2017]